MSAPDPAFDALVSAGPIVDMIGDSRMEYDGPRCAGPDDDDCGAPVDDDGEMCPTCADQPHAFRPFRLDKAHWCACGRGPDGPVHQDDDERGAA